MFGNRKLRALEGFFGEGVYACFSRDDGFASFHVGSAWSFDTGVGVLSFLWVHKCQEANDGGLCAISSLLLGFGLVLVPIWLGFRVYRVYRVDRVCSVYKV